MTELLPPSLVAISLDVPVEAVGRWTREGILPYRELEGTWYVVHGAFEVWREVLATDMRLRELPAGPDRTRQVRTTIIRYLLLRQGIQSTVGQWMNAGNLLPSWREVMGEPVSA